MSQQNNYTPVFNYSETLYPDFASAWPGQGSRAASLAGATSSPTFRTDQIIPNPRPASLVNIDASNMSQQTNRADPRLTLLQVPNLTRPRSALDNADIANPIARFWIEPDGPWSSQGVGSGTFSNSRSSISQPHTFNRLRDSPRSEIESLAPRSDSGYYTHQTHSIMSNDQDRCDQELPMELFRVRNMNVSSVHSGATETHPNPAADQISQYSGRSTRNGKELQCRHCGEVSKCQSDQKKHMLKHEKPFKCDIPNCKRAGKGFTTVNDLIRHRKSVHHIDVCRGSYKCASDNCRNRDKIWPRLDNFKQHIQRMHPSEDPEKLIERSKIEAQHIAAVETPSVAPMDTTLAGIAPDRQFSNTGFEDPASGMSLTPDQASNTWATYVAPDSSEEFAMDVDHSGSNSYGQNPSKPNVLLNTGNKSLGKIPNVILDSNAASMASVANSRNNSHRLDTLATVASSQSSPDMSIGQTPSAVPPPQLSRAPQTKVEQQKHTFLTLSKMVAGEIQSSSSIESGDLEAIVLRSLYNVFPRLGKKGKSSIHSSSLSQGSVRGSSAAEKNASVHMDTELHTTRQLEHPIPDMNKNGTKRLTGTSNRLNLVSSNMKACERCDVTFHRSCDMRKHMKRHTRPYACTYPKCNKRFGAKSDWKRHENSQHFQLESYRCEVPSPSSQFLCGELFFRQELFQQHLKKEHNKTDEEEIEKETKLRRIGRNGQGQFWCGFCISIVKLEKKRNAAWDERFDHIDHHFMKDKRHIEDWYCIEAKKTKGDLSKEMDRTKFEEEDDGNASMGNERSPTGDSPADSSHHAPPPPPPPPQQQTYLKSQLQMPPPPAPSSELSAPLVARSNKRPATSEAAGPSQPNKHARRSETQWYCCQCNDGPFNSVLHTTCMNTENCGHQWCRDCPQ